MKSTVYSKHDQTFSEPMNFVKVNFALLHVQCKLCISLFFFFFFFFYQNACFVPQEEMDNGHHRPATTHTCVSTTPGVAHAARVTCVPGFTTASDLPTSGSSRVWVTGKTSPPPTTKTLRSASVLWFRMKSLR